MKKTYVLDTNVLLSDPNSIFSFQDNDLIVPMVVLEELDRHKSRPDEVGKNARQVTRALDSLRERGNLTDGVRLKEGGILKVGRMSQVAVSEAGLDPTKPDNMIIAYAQATPNAILVSKDINVRIKCDSLGVKCEDYLKMRVADDAQKFYRGVEVIELEEQLIDYFYHSGKLDLPNDALKGRKLYPNQIIVIKNVQGGQTTKSAITKHLGPGQPLIPVAKIDNVFGLKPRNKEQSFSLDLLFDPEIKLLTLAGPSGCVDPATSVSVRLTNLSWQLPVPDDTYLHVDSEDEQEIENC